MNKRINIESLVQAKSSLAPESFASYLEYYGIGIKDDEINDLDGLSRALRLAGCSICDLGDFYVGYKIPQIGKEFDVLRFGVDLVLNIEIKSRCSEEKIEKQLKRNKYYLKFIEKAVCAFTFVSESNEVYLLGDSGRLERVGVDYLADLIKDHKADSYAVPDALFNPSEFLVSPFNSTERFLAREYFLTQQQEEVREKVQNLISSPGAERFISITGGAGTGKTLLTYDICMDAMSRGVMALIVHCGQINRGQSVLIDKGWEIASIRDYKKYKIDSYDLIVIDEAQRIYSSQLEEIVSGVRKNKACCIFSYDKLQTLASWEKRNDASVKIESISHIVKYRLSDKIRTNKEISGFIKMLFNNRKSVKVSSYGNIEISYFKSPIDARSYLDVLGNDGWEVLRFTPSQYKRERHEEYSILDNKTSHQVIGQEFDSVAVVIDEHFSYDGNGELVYKGGSYYDAAKMLFQNITRSRRRLNVVIIGNEELLGRCIGILE